jgi:hypothetical protein
MLKEEVFVAGLRNRPEFRHLHILYYEDAGIQVESKELNEKTARQRILTS